MISSRGSQAPTFAICPSCEDGDGAVCAELARRFGLSLLPWQRELLEGMLLREGDGLWASPTSGISVPRQNGKTDGVIVPRAVYGMAVLGEWVLYTAQLQKTANETFRRVRDVFESPALAGTVKQVHLGRGFEEVELKNGARMKFLARTRNGGRGQHADLMIFDEAQELTDAELESFSPAISASANPQTLYLGTPPTPDSPGTVFRRIRKEAHAGAGGTFWAEWSVDAIPENADDEALWAKTNPSLGTLILPRTIAKEAVEMSPDGFARERLGWWSPDTGAVTPAIDPKDWKDCEVKEPDEGEDERLACGVKFSADGTVYALAMAARPKAGPVLVECIDRAGTARGISGLADWIAARRNRLSTVRVDGRQWTTTLVQALAERGFPSKALEIAKTSGMVDACAMFAGAVMAGDLVHIAQPILDNSIATSPKRQIGTDGWGFAGADPTPAEACALAYWGAMTTKRRAGRKMKVSV